MDRDTGQETAGESRASTEWRIWRDCRPAGRATDDRLLLLAETRRATQQSGGRGSRADSCRSDANKWTTEGKWGRAKTEPLTTRLVAMSGHGWTADREREGRAELESEEGKGLWAERTREAAVSLSRAAPLESRAALSSPPLPSPSTPSDSAACLHPSSSSRPPLPSPLPLPAKERLTPLHFSVCSPPSHCWLRRLRWRRLPPPLPSKRPFTAAFTVQCALSSAECTS